MADPLRLPPAAQLLGLFLRLFAWLALVAGLIVFMIAGWAYLRSRPYGDGVTATAIVVDNRPVDIQGATNYRPVVAFEIDGRRYEIESAIAEGDRLEIGSAIEVSYLPGEPNNARVAAPGVLLMRTATLAGAAAAATGLLLLSPIVAGRLASADDRRKPSGETPDGEIPPEGKELDEI